MDILERQLFCATYGVRAFHTFFYYYLLFIRTQWFSVGNDLTPGNTWQCLETVLVFPGGSAGKESSCNAGYLGWEDPLEKGMATHSSILA